LVALTLTGCIGADFGNVAFRCGVGDSCPTDFACDPRDGMCHRTPFPILPDGGGSNTPDADSDGMVHNTGPGDTCGNADKLTVATNSSLTTVGENDDYTLACVHGGDSVDRVNQLTLGSPQAVLVTVTPAAPGWAVAAALRPDASCTSRPPT
jgi:hypothetical protein